MEIALLVELHVERLAHMRPDGALQSRLQHPMLGSSVLPHHAWKGILICRVVLHKLFHMRLIVPPVGLKRLAPAAAPAMLPLVPDAHVEYHDVVPVNPKQLPVRQEVLCEVPQEIHSDVTHAGAAYESGAGWHLPCVCFDRNARRPEDTIQKLLLELRVILRHSLRYHGFVRQKVCEEAAHGLVPV
eukprot:CAMPEP_0117687302 /NCGR_PEP_ID=MMETSP0804-20121206/23053_1 /TAXON_ID=1074897 /ORGANISM="Tetraselmis astigmatica, Strain CCMP880" /LENGTH=185 /DNA_ID=CAMNT_0005499337 /DNA_START=341 /DNA_END=894 /DNA_ORIENTATION=-